MIKIQKFILVAGLFAITQSFGQTKSTEEDAKAERKFPVHSFGLAIGHAFIFEGGKVEGENKTLNVPMWGIDYNLQLSRKWVVGLHTDFLVESFMIETKHDNGNTETIQRSYPIAPAIMGFFKPNEHWSFGLGAGEEFAKEENLFLNRAALEYGVEIRKGWEVFGVLQYDIRWNAYDTWSIGMGISKALGKN